MLNKKLFVLWEQEKEISAYNHNMTRTPKVQGLKSESRAESFPSPGLMRAEGRGHPRGSMGCLGEMLKWHLCSTPIPSTSSSFGVKVG